MPDRDDLPPPDDDSTTAAVPPDHAPDRIGPYKLLERIGEGGMGVVYLAEQEAPLRRRVALKVIKPGMDSKQVLARFEAERQALALMNHPGVAKVFDAGSTPEGRPYFVMEHVPGVPITDYCDRHLLDNRSRMELFIQVCGAIQHAHQKGIIHRDIKPSNVLVALIDGRPHPKVIDFGVAKATQQHLTEQTLFTQQGVLIGTPEYMSPEQAEMNALDIDTRSDVYSLGVLLYELLVGSLPFDPKVLRQAAFHEMQRIIRETAPPKPSTRIAPLSDASREAARRRDTDPRSLQRQIRGDLDWIAMKALEKDRIRRYPSASELAADLIRHLNNEPVEAGPPTVRYRLATLVRRNRAAVFSALAVVAALLLGLGATSYQWVRAERSFAKVNQLKEEAEANAYRLSIPMASMYLQQGNDSEAAAQLLFTSRSPRRGWEWGHMLHRLRSGARIVIDSEPAISCDQIAFSSNGEELVGVSASGPEHGYVRARLQDGAIQPGPTEVMALDRENRGGTDAARHGEELHILALAPGGTRAVLTRSRRTKENKAISSLERRRAGVVEVPSLEQVWSGDVGTRAVFDRDGEILVTAKASCCGDDDRYQITILDSRSGRELRRLPETSGSLRVLAVSVRGGWLAAGLSDGSIDVWRMDTGSWRRHSAVHHGAVLSADSDPDGKWLVTSGDDGFINVLSPSGHVASRRWEVSAQGETSADVHQLVAVHPGGNILAVATSVGALRTYEIQTGQLRNTRFGFGRISDVRFSQDGGFLAVASSRGIRVMDSFGADFGRTFESNTAPRAIRFDPRSLEVRVLGAQSRKDDGYELRRIETDRRFDALNQSDGRERFFGYLVTLAEEPPSPMEAIAAAFFDGGGKFVEYLQGSRGDGTPNTSSLRIRDSETGRVLRDAAGVAEVVTRIAVGENGRWAAGVSSTGPLHLWSFPDGAHRVVANTLPGPLGPLAFDPSGRLIALGTGNGVAIIDVEEGRTSNTSYWDLNSLRPHWQRIWDIHAIASIAFSPDGKWIVSVERHGDENWQAWRIVKQATSQESSMARRTHFQALPLALAFSPDGRRIALGSAAWGLHSGGELRIIDAESLEPLLSLDEFTGQEGIMALAFSPDGRWLASAHLNGNIRVFDSKPPELFPQHWQ